MGLLDKLRRRKDGPASSVIASPWTDAELSRIVWSDIFGSDSRPLGRADAMSIPPVARGRHLIVGMIARCPLTSWRDTVQIAPAAWMQRTNQVSPWHRMAWTVDDLVFTGWSLWAVNRDADNVVIEADRVGRDRWNFDGATGAVSVDSEPVDDKSVILLPGPHEGILNFGSRNGIRHALSLYRAAENAANNPIAATELHQTGGDPLSSAEVAELLASWRAARLDPAKAGVSFTNQSIEAKFHGQPAGQFLIDARNAAALDIARFLGLPGSTIDATVDKASLNYETTAGRNAELIDIALAPYMDAITGRLSMDDVVPRGQRVAFDTDVLRTLTPAPTGPPTED